MIEQCKECMGMGKIMDVVNREMAICQECKGRGVMKTKEGEKLYKVREKVRDERLHS